MDERFDKWNAKKKETETKQETKVGVGRIYWVRVGQNIGSEIYGKQADFRRPVLVLNKIYIPNHLNLFVGIPLTSKTNNKYGSLYHHFMDSKGRKQVALLPQIRMFDTKRVVTYHSKIQYNKQGWIQRI